MLLQDSQTAFQNDRRRPYRSVPIKGATEVPLTAVARRAIEHELNELRYTREREIPARLRNAREFGEVGNNDEHLAIREEEAVLAARIARLEDVLARAVLVDRADADDSVAIGSHVGVIDVGTGEKRDYVIDGAHGAGKPGTVSALSPIGRAVLGRRRGDRVSVELPSGRRRELRVRDIRVSCPT